MTLPEYDDRVFFAGEHISAVHRWMQGALQSGVKAANNLAIACKRYFKLYTSHLKSYIGFLQSKISGAEKNIQSLRIFARAECNRLCAMYIDTIFITES